MARPKLIDEGVGKPICVRLTEDLTSQLSLAAKQLDMPQSEIMRLCMRIGIEHFKRIDYDTAKCIVDAVESQARKPQLHGLNEPKLGDPAPTPPAPSRVTYEKPKRPKAGGSGSTSLRMVAEEHEKDEGNAGL